MDAATSVFLIIVLFILTGLSIGAALFIAQRIYNPDPSPVQARLAQLKSKESDERNASEKELAKKMANLYKASDYQNVNLGKFLDRYPFIEKLKRNLSQAGMKVAVDRFFITWYALPFVFGLVLAATTKIILFVMLGLFVPVIANVVVLFKKSRRLKKFINQFPDALNLMSSSLRAGHSFQSALTVVASELQDPLSTEFSLVVKDFNLGIPIRDALERMMVNLDGLADIRMFVTAVLIQRESGGNLAEILDKISYTIRERFKLRGQVSALTGQSRLTGYVLAAAPLIMAILLSIVNPGYFKPMFEMMLGQLLIVVGILMQITGFLIIRKIVDIRV